MNVTFYLSHDIKIACFIIAFWRENVKILPSFSQRYNGCDYIMLPNLQTTSGLSILLHDVISLQDATSCDNCKSVLPLTLYGLLYVCDALSLKLN